MTTTLTPVPYLVTVPRRVPHTATLDQLRDDMQRHGLRYSELMAHIEDVDAGHVVTADDGTTFTLR